MKFTRRRLVLGATLAGGAAGVAALMFIGRDRSSFLRRSLEQMVGPFRMPDEDFAAFQAEIEAILTSRLGNREGPKWDLTRTVSRFGLLDLVAAASSTVQDKVEIYRREVVTHFILATDWLDAPADGGLRDVRYSGINPACANPFAVFD